MPCSGQDASVRGRTRRRRNTRDALDDLELEGRARVLLAHPQGRSPDDLGQGDTEAFEIRAVHGAHRGAGKEEQRRRARCLEAGRVEDRELRARRA